MNQSAYIQNEIKKISIPRLIKPAENAQIIQGEF